jgi:hypothetical protein
MRELSFRAHHDAIAWLSRTPGIPVDARGGAGRR